MTRPSEDAGYFLRTLSAKLGLTDKYIQTAFEDTWYYLWRERRLPVNVDPFNSKLDDEMERARLRRVFEQKLETPVGYVLPLKPAGSGASSALAGPAWTTGPWFFRDERMYLMPGDSPMGLRLPLDSLPWVSQGDFPYLTEQDPYSPRDRLPLHAALAARYSPYAAPVSTAAGTQASAGGSMDYLALRRCEPPDDAEGRAQAVPSDRPRSAHRVDDHVPLRAAAVALVLGASVA